MSKPLTAWSVAELADGLGKKEICAVETARAYLDRIEECEPDIGAYITVTAERAMEQAAAADAERAAGETLPLLAGVPAGLKDNICTSDAPTTCASRMLEHFTPPYDAAVVERLAAQRTVMLGKLNMDEFAMGSTTESSWFRPTRNPRDLTRVPGGSSGGSAAAVAAGEAAFALGTDTGGSIRQPAAFCGVVGMKPTYGAVSRYGVVAFASSLDQVGPLTRTVRDNAMVLEALCAYDERDATSLRYESAAFTADLDKGVDGLRIGLPKEFFGEGVAPDVRQAVQEAARTYERLGAHIVELSIPTMEYALSAYYVISSAEASSNLARFDGVKYGFRAAEFADIDDLYRTTRSEGFGMEVKRRILLGTFVLSAGYYDAYYKKAQQVRTLVREEFGRALERCDCLLSPVTPTTAYRLGEKCDDPLAMYMGDVFGAPANIAGIPALSLPCGADAQGLPVGMQLIGRPFGEALLYRAAHAFEQEARVTFNTSKDAGRMGGAAV